MLHTLSDKSSHTYEEQTKLLKIKVQNQAEMTHKQKKKKKSEIKNLGAFKDEREK